METATVFRSENKYLISKCDALSMRKKFDILLTRDQNVLQESYMVRSLYFDSINNIDYMTKLAGTESRKKIRIRTYSSGAEHCRLEIKQKSGDLQRKSGIWITKKDVEELCKCNYSVLTKYFSVSPDTVFIYSLLTRGCYRPVVLVEYDRIAYTFPLFNTRLTIDMNIRSNEGGLDLFSKGCIYQMLSTDNYVLEVKYNEKLVKFISDILKEYHLTKCSVSKYCLSRKIFCDFCF